VISEKDSAIFCLKTFIFYIQKDGTIIRKLRDIYWAIKGKNKVLILLSPVLCIPKS